MPAYRTLIEGRNFLLNIDGRSRRYGFYQTVFVSATDPTEMETLAVGAVKNAEDLKALVQNERADPPMLLLDSYEELDDAKPLPTAEGRTYYVEKRWWQFWR